MVEARAPSRRGTRHLRRPLSWRRPINPAEPAACGGSRSGIAAGRAEAKVWRRAKVEHHDEIPPQAEQGRVCRFGPGHTVAPETFHRAIHGRHGAAKAFGPVED